MTRIAIVSDIHANLAAFFMVLLEFQEKPVDMLLNLGDTVGYYSKPNEVLALLNEFKRNLKYHSVMGNHDISVASFIYHDLFTPEFVAAIGESFIKSTNYNAQESWNWTISQLDGKLSHILIDETSKTLEIGGGVRFHLVHGAPHTMRGKLEDEVGFYLTLNQIKKNENGLSKFFESEAIDIMLTGHTHIPHKTNINDTILINPGSVGQPRDGDLRTSFVILDALDGKISNIELIRIPYPINDRIMAHFATSAEDSLLSEFSLDI